ncbi:MAG: hypothetical protein A2527_11015 [Candidatus Lambdaproteobacteria bacterium RIFOXYD2_FULL_50_16]|uniref:AB hydrolase-1 domain-containing protein n=1 Tax=Candidatus Lambdaproteobacteria bacterium RIFOXYD2_FULL_50_16 TaxID=1817772 RepID=A0A1F6G6B2_9PROT|nr:MAG: hypothetical protein A2527_11015 [Candidatus Lambdaproteobacteria bacterium RIFOXYD2_FULL_50_16]
MEAVFFHGWALDRHFFDPLASALGFKAHFFDRGYFGPPQRPNKPVGPFILVTHSFGLHWVPLTWVKEAQALVIINGFIQFHPQGDLAAISKRGFKNLRLGLSLDPDQTLKRFYQKVTSPGEAPWPFKSITDLDLAEKDLDLLGSSQFELDPLRVLKKLLLFSALADQIVLPEKADQLAEELPQAKRFVYPEAGHDLGHFMAPKVAQNILEAL